MSGFSRRTIGIAAGVIVAALVDATAVAHPWHRQRRPAGEPAPAAAPVDRPGGSPFRLAAAAREEPAAIESAFAPFVAKQAITTRRDDRWFYVESDGMPDHPLMVGIRAWQQQVPLPQPYTGDNAWQIPLEPVRAEVPALTKDRFLRVAIAVAVNGVPIFNPLNNRGEDALAIGELDEYGGHCGRSDDYHYHIAPVHLEEVVGKGRPVAYALDGYPVYGFSEPDGAAARALDELGGHDHSGIGYHYHALEQYPYLIGGFRGEVVEREGQVDPQPRARGVREALTQLKGASIVGFTAPDPTSRVLTYEIRGRRGTVAYSFAPDGSATFTFTEPGGRPRTEEYQPRRRGPDRQPPPGGGRRPPRERGPRGQEAAGAAPAGTLEVTSPAFAAGGPLPATYACDGEGVSPPIEWRPGPRGTKSYAVVIWHEAPDAVKSYWVVYGIPAAVTKLPADARDVGTVGLNGKKRTGYDPMCSKGPGKKEYRISVFALSTMPRLPAASTDREALLEAIAPSTLAEGVLSFTYERPVSP